MLAMQLMILVTADYASIDQATGKLNILGAFSRISTTKRFPIRHQRMSLALKLRADLEDHHDIRSLTIEMTDEDGNRLFHISGPFQFPQTGKGIPGEYNAIVELNGLEFPHPGFYEFLVYVDGKKVGQTPIELVERNQQSE
jgi:hypothetical protein